MSLSYFSFLNPLSKNSGVKLSKYAKIQRPEGSDKIEDKTVVENGQLLYKDYQNTKENQIGIYPDYPRLTEMEFIYKALTGLHYGVYTNLNEPKDKDVGGIGAKGILDFLIFPLVARKILLDSLLFIGNDENYQFTGTIDDLYKGIGWASLIPSVALALSLEIIRLSLAAALTLLTVYVAVPLLVATAVVTAPIWLPAYAIYDYCISKPPTPVETNDEEASEDRYLSH